MTKKENEMKIPIFPFYPITAASAGQCKSIIISENNINIVPIAWPGPSKYLYVRRQITSQS